MTAPAASKAEEARAFMKFVVSGGLAAGVNVASRYVISRWLPFEAAVTLAYGLGMTTAFLLTKAFVFKRSDAHWLLEYGRFALVNVVAFVQVLLVSEGLVRWLFPRLGFHWHPEEIGHLIGVMSPIVTSYYAHKHFSFRPAASLEPKPLSAAPRRAPKATEPPLIVDVDGTLVRTDLLQEAALQFVARFPLEIWRLLAWLLKGKSTLKAELAARVNPGISSVPLRAETLDLIHLAQAEGRRVYLASASDHRYVQELADRIGGIAGVFATEPGTNLAGSAKAQRLETEFGVGGFDYIGDQPVDFAVWRSARKQIAVSHSGGFTRRVRAAFPEVQVIAEPRAPARAYVKALRPHQWAKNALVFLPTIAGHQFTVPSLLVSFVAFACFSLAASSAYLINDLLDLPGDRDHATKHRRPFAAGVIPIPAGIGLSLLLMVTSAALSFLLPLDFSLVLLAYVALTLSYSFYLKRKLIVDVITLGALYTIRVLGGIRAVDQPPSPWLLTFCLFLFLSLATVKRCSEMIARREAGKGAALGRGYRPGDLDALMPLAAAAGYGAVLVVTLYLASPEVARLYSHPFRMWLICPALLYWISRVLVLSSRNELHDDPVVFALTDRVSWLTGAYAGAVIAVSL